MNNRGHGSGNRLLYIKQIKCVHPPVTFCTVHDNVNALERQSMLYHTSFHFLLSQFEVNSFCQLVKKKKSAGRLLVYSTDGLSKCCLTFEYGNYVLFPVVMPQTTYATCNMRKSFEEIQPLLQVVCASSLLSCFCLDLTTQPLQKRVCYVTFF